MKILKIASISLLLIYIGLVAVFESLLGYYQPSDENTTIVITTYNSDLEARDRVVSRIDSDAKLYVAANHWPRAWYRRALSNPKVEVTFKGEKNIYLAIPVEGIEHDRVNKDKALPLRFKILTGFPPRYFLRLEPQTEN